MKHVCGVGGIQEVKEVVMMAGGCLSKCACVHDCVFVCGGFNA